MHFLVQKFITYNIRININIATLTDGKLISECTPKALYPASQISRSLLIANDETNCVSSQPVNIFNLKITPGVAPLPTSTPLRVPLYEYPFTSTPLRVHLYEYTCTADKVAHA